MYGTFRYRIHCTTNPPLVQERSVPAACAWAGGEQAECAEGGHAAGQTSGQQQGLRGQGQPGKVLFFRLFSCFSLLKQEVKIDLILQIKSSNSFLIGWSAKSVPVLISLIQTEENDCLLLIHTSFARIFINNMKLDIRQVTQALYTGIQYSKNQ